MAEKDVMGDSKIVRQARNKATTPSPQKREGGGVVRSSRLNRIKSYTGKTKQTKAEDVAGVKYHVTASQKKLYVWTAIVFDILEAILAFLQIGVALNYVVAVIKWLWFLIVVGPKITNASNQNILNLLITMIISIIPYIRAAPEFSIFISSAIDSSRKIDEQNAGIS